MTELQGSDREVAQKSSSGGQPAPARRKRHPLAKIKGGWTPEEDAELIRLVHEMGEGNWSPIARALNAAIGKDESNGRIGKQCRERWNHHLRPDIKKDAWNREEEELLVKAHQELGNRWSDIAKTIPGRSENAVKNHWNATLRRRDLPDPDPGPLKIYMQSLNLTKPQTRGRRAPAGGAKGRAAAAINRRRARRDYDDDTDSGYTTDEHNSSESSQEREEKPLMHKTSVTGDRTVEPVSSGLLPGAQFYPALAPPPPLPSAGWPPAASSPAASALAPQASTGAADGEAVHKRRRVSTTGECPGVRGGHGAVHTRSGGLPATDARGQEADSLDRTHSTAPWYPLHAPCPPHGEQAPLHNHALPAPALPPAPPTGRAALHGGWSFPTPGMSSYTTPSFWANASVTFPPVHAHQEPSPSIFAGGSFSAVRPRTSTSGGTAVNVQDAAAPVTALATHVAAPRPTHADAQLGAMLRDMTVSPGIAALEAALALASPGALAGASGGPGSFLFDSEDVELMEMLNMAAHMPAGDMPGVGGSGGKVHGYGGVVVKTEDPGHSWCQPIVCGKDGQPVTRSGSNSSLHSSYSTGPHSPTLATTTPFTHVPAPSRPPMMPASHGPAFTPTRTDSVITRLFRAPPNNILYVSTGPLPPMDTLLQRHLPASNVPMQGSKVVTLRMGSKGPIRVCMPELCSRLSAAGIPAHHMQGSNTGVSATDAMVSDLARMVQHVCHQVSQQAGLEGCLVAIRLGGDIPVNDYSVLLAVRGSEPAGGVSQAVEAISAGLSPLFC